MIFTLLNHSWQSFWRSKSLGRSLGATIFTWVMMGLMLLYVVVLGYMLEDLLVKLKPDEEPINLLNGYLLFYWMFELILRIVFQKNVTLHIQYYLTQRISRNLLAHFMLLKSWANLFLFISMLLFSRFAFSTVANSYNVNTDWLWFEFILLVSFCLHHLVIFIHQKTKGKAIVPFLLSVICIVLIYANYMGLVDVTFITQQMMISVIKSPVLITLPVLISIGLYFYNHRLIRENLSLDTLPQNVIKAGSGVSNWVSYLSSFGIIGQLIAVELRLIWRNKRPRMALIMGPLMVVYFYIFLDKEPRSIEMVQIVMLIATGAITINYGQFLFSWESKYFDWIVTRRFTMEEYLKSKFYILSGFNTISLIVCGVTLFFIDVTLFDKLILWYFVNTGIFTYMFIWIALFGSKRIDSNASAMFNYEGIKASQFLMIIPYIALPIGGIYLIDSNIGEGYGILILGGIGVIGVVMLNPIIRAISRLFLKRKYKILVGLRD